MKKVFVALLCILSLSGVELNAKILNDSISPAKNFEKAAFRLWYPDDLPFIRAIVVLVPGSNGDGRSQVADSAWQVFAMRNRMALLGCYFTDQKHPDQDIELYVKAGVGSGDALLGVIAGFARKSGHGELKGAPLLLWGHSAGGQFNYEFVCWKPALVLGFVVNKGGIYYTALTSASARQVPGIFFTGEKDLEFRSDIVKGIFAANRRFGALWTIAQEPGAGHEVGQTKNLAILYFDEIIRLRLAQQSADQSVKSELTSLREDAGFVGDPKTHQIVPFAGWTKTRYPTAWLPSSGFGEKWLAFIEGRSF